jgi:hypothetical protein
MIKGFVMLRFSILPCVLFVSMVQMAFCQVTASIEEASKNPKQLIAFQMSNWKTKHFNDAAEAAKHAKILAETLKCEVKSAKHNGHTDVTCRTTVWKSVSCDTEEQATQWRTWLDAAGFETIYGRKAVEEKTAPVAGTPAKEIVKYRSTEWKSLHLNDPIQPSQYVAIYSGLGCETTLEDHGNHKDLRIRCPEWMEIELPSHASAHKWQEFLNKAGFETAHEH